MIALLIIILILQAATLGGLIALTVAARTRRKHERQRDPADSEPFLTRFPRSGA